MPSFILPSEVSLFSFGCCFTLEDVSPACLDSDSFLIRNGKAAALARGTGA
jgi:hypothetical protein